MREFLNKAFHEGATVNEFVRSLEETRWADDTGKHLPPALMTFGFDPRGVSRAIFTFLATAPRELSETVGLLLKDSQGMALSEEEHLELKALSAGVHRMGTLLDEFTKKIAKQRAWRAIYNAPVSVTRVWRTKRDEQVVGVPEERKVPVDQMPTRMASMVMVEEETNKGVRTRPMLALSDGQYRMDGAIGEVREDFLLDLPEMFGHGNDSAWAAGRGRKGCTKEHTQDLFTELVMGGMELFHSILEVAKPLVERELVSSDLFDFKVQEVIASKPLKAEDNPEAKYEIGGWA